MELTELTLSEAASFISKTTLSPVALTHACLARIEQLDPLLYCFITRTPELALAAAREAEADIRYGAYRGPLHGIPIALKDVFEVQGIRTTGGAKGLADSISTSNSAAVEKLKDAGAILLGKLNMYEWAMKADSYNPTFGTCRNPWNVAYTAGGSSSGSAAAVAAELCPASLGSDTGGSVRIPASLCGVVGFKPTYGRISTRGMLPLSQSIDHVGLLARRTLDVALLLQIVAGYDSRSPYSINVPCDSYIAHLHEGVRGRRIAVAYQPFLRTGEQVDENILQAVHEAVLVFEQLGASIEEIKLPFGAALRDCNALIVLSEAAAIHQKELLTTPGAFSHDVLECLKEGMAFTAIEYIQARETQREAQRQFERIFQEYELILTPTAPIAAFHLIEDEAIKAMRPSLTAFTAAWNLLGLPALSLPCGFTNTDLPIGLQLIGPAWSEARVLSASYAYEQATDWHTRRPKLNVL
ncbi:MAG: amidase [Ktedonobacteraceae bacterium]